MRFLADENFPGAAIRSLKEAGHDVLSIAADAPSSSDREVLARASTEGRERLPARCGVVLFRCAMPAPAAVGPALAAMLAQRQDWSGHFSVIEDGRVRMRKIDE